MRGHLRRDGELADCEVWGVLPRSSARRWRAAAVERPGRAAGGRRAPPRPTSSSARSRSWRRGCHAQPPDLDGCGSACASDRARDSRRRGTGRHLSPTGFPGLGPSGTQSGNRGYPALEPASVNWSPTGLVSVFIRHRVGSRRRWRFHRPQPRLSRRPRADAQEPPQRPPADSQEPEERLRGVRAVSGPDVSDADLGGFHQADIRRRCTAAAASVISTTPHTSAEFSPSPTAAAACGGAWRRPVAADRCSPAATGSCTTTSAVPATPTCATRR